MLTDTKIIKTICKSHFFATVCNFFLIQITIQQNIDNVLMNLLHVVLFSFNVGIQKNIHNVLMSFVSCCELFLDSLVFCCAVTVCDCVYMLEISQWFWSCMREFKKDGKFFHFGDVSFINGKSSYDRLSSWWQDVMWMRLYSVEVNCLLFKQHHFVLSGYGINGLQLHVDFQHFHSIHQQTPMLLI